MGIKSEIERIAAAKAALKTAINARGGSLTTEHLESYSAAVIALPQGADVSGVTATAADVAADKKFVTAEGMLTDGTLATVMQPAPTVSLNAETGVVTASYTPVAGQVKNTAAKSATLNLTAQSAVTITPGIADQTIVAGKFLTGAITVSGDANLAAANIAVGKTIFGVNGSFTADATATAADIASGKTAYVNGVKLTGSASGGNVIPVYVVNSARIFGNDLPIASKIAVPPREIVSVGTHLVCINGNLYHAHEGDNGNAYDKGVCVSSTGDWSFVAAPYEGNVYACIKNGQLVRVYEYESGGGYGQFSVRIPDNPLSVSQIVRAEECVWALSGTTAYCVQIPDAATFPMKATEKPIAKLLNQFINDWSFLHACAAIAADGSVGILSCEWNDNPGDGSTSWTEICANNNNDPFLNYYHYADEGGGFGGGYVRFAIRSSGLWYQVNGSGSWAQVQNGPTLRSGDWLGYAVTSADEDWSGEEPTMIISESTVALHVDTFGRLWKLAAIADASGNITGVSVTQVGSDTNWNYVPPTINRNGSGWAQKGGKLGKITASNTNTLAISWAEEYLSPGGRLIAQNFSGLWFFGKQGPFDVAKSGGVIE